MSDLCPVAVSRDSTENEYQPETIGESNLLLLQQKKYCDVTFTFPNLPGRIEAHEFVLKTRSPVFAQIFRMRKYGNAKSKDIEISESTPQRFQQFLEFIYADKFEVDIAGALDLLHLSQEYKVHPLAKKCEEFLKTEIKVEHSIEIFEAARRYDRKDLMDRAAGIMIKSFGKLIEINALAKAEKETVLYLLGHDDLCVEEVKLFQFILDWGRSQVGDPADEKILKRKLKNVISKIRYTNMTLQEFTKVVVPTGLLSAEESLSVYSYFGGDDVTRGALNMKFNTTRRRVQGVDKFVDFFADQQLPRCWAPAFCFQTLQFKVERPPQVVKKEGSDCTQKTAAISRIQLQLPQISEKYKPVAAFNFKISIHEYDLPFNMTSTLKFYGGVVTHKQGVSDDISVEPPVELIYGRKYAVTVGNYSPAVVKESFRKDPCVYFGDVHSTTNRIGSGDLLGDGSLDLKETHMGTMYYSHEFSNGPHHFAVIKAITIEMV